MANEPRITLDRSSPVPLYFQVAEQLEAAILDGSLGAGDRISNEVSLAQNLGLSRPTMRQAIQVLVDKGMLVRKRGVGTQVVHGKIRRSVELTSLYDDLNAAGQKPHTEVLGIEITATTEEIAHELQIAPGEPAWSLERIRYVGPEPLALMHNYLPAETIDLTVVDLEAHGLYEALR
ncbi:MAG: GntR family transcriptional regulator, partial [Actinomycetia bacterium]|nr:GntR family transcriptional regulator [Actinomycetes bacterium]